MVGKGTAKLRAMNVSRRSVGVLLLTLALSACKKDTANAATPGKRLSIAVIPKGTTHEFWKTVHAGALTAAKEADVDIVWKGPLKEDDLKAQIDVVQSFVAQGVSGIVLAPLSDKGLVGAVSGAKAAKIPVVVFDSDLKSDDPASFVATDNYAAGKLAADALAKKIDNKGNVVVLRYQEGSASTMNREKGFLDGIKAYPQIRVVSDNQYGGATTESASKVAESLLAAQKVGDGNVAGVFTPNESTTFGILLALRKGNHAGKVKFVGFDSSEKLVGALKEGHIDGLVLQDPFKMGYLAVKSMADQLRGKAIEKKIDTGAKLVGKDNLETPEIRALLTPNLKILESVL
jgi:ribose transport system substrate-binding protein